MLKLALEKCRDFKIAKVLVTCEVANVGSAAVIKKCGGIFQNEVIDPDGRPLQRYWIPLD